MTEISASSIVTSVAASVIAAGIIWLASETHNHGVTLTHVSDKIDEHGITLSNLTAEVTGEPNGLRAKALFLYNTVLEVKKQNEDSSRKQEEQRVQIKSIKDRLDIVDGDHGRPRPAPSLDEH